MFLCRNTEESPSRLCLLGDSSIYPRIFKKGLPSAAETKKSRLSAFCLFQFVYFASDSRENI